MTSLIQLLRQASLYLRTGSLLPFTSTEISIVLMKHLFLLLFFATLAVQAKAQEPAEIVEVYGVVVTKNDRQTYDFVPFVTVAVEGTARGTYANFEGMYSIVVKKGQTLTFSAVGYAPRKITIPTDLNNLYHSLTVELEPAEIHLEEVTVFPWPDRDNLAAEFLAMQPGRAGQLQEIAKDNLNRNNLLAVVNATDQDSRETAIQYMRQQARDYSYQGQIAPQSIFDPIAWGKFFNQYNKNKKSRTARENHMIRVLEGENE